MLVYDRKTKKVFEENQLGNNYLKFLYRTFLGRMILKILVHPFISRIYGKYNDSKISLGKVDKWIKKYNFDKKRFEKDKFENFNDFFARKYREINHKFKDTDFVAPAESKLMVYNVNEDLILNIKDSSYDINDLVDNKVDVNKYKNGLCLVYYLTVDCYHRYAHIDDGKIISSSEIKGKLHTVNPISSKYKVYSRNHRVFSLIQGKNFGNYIYMEVGAMMVGKIVNNNKKQFKKGDEKGYFKLGASTVVILVEKDRVKIDKDILENSKEGIASKVDYLEIVGQKTWSKR